MTCAFDLSIPMGKKVGRDDLEYYLGPDQVDQCEPSSLRPILSNSMNWFYILFFITDRELYQAGDSPRVSITMSGFIWLDPVRSVEIPTFILWIIFIIIYKNQTIYCCWPGKYFLTRKVLEILKYLLMFSDLVSASGHSSLSSNKLQKLHRYQRLELQQSVSGGAGGATTVRQV